MAQSNLEFFKVYLPELSAQHMRIPPAFVGLLNGTITAVVTLKDFTGKTWKVKLEEDDTDLFIRKGWQEFAYDHSLKFGDFLIFNFDGKRQFDVKIFGTNGCLKKDVLCDALPKTHLRKEPGGIPEPTSNWRRKNFENGSKTREKSGLSGVNFKRYTTVESLQRSDVSQYASLVVPENPHFVSTLAEGFSNLYIPKLMLQEYHITLNKIVEIRDENGRMWPVRISRGTDGRFLLGAGWGNFRKFHELLPKDKLIIELIVDDTKKCHQMLVQVLRQSRTSGSSAEVDPKSPGTVLIKDELIV